LLLGTDNDGRKPWHFVALFGKLETLNKVWEWGEEKLITEEINNKLLLGTDKEGMTAWHWAAERGHLEILHKILEWAEKQQRM
jgi:ankyrin repeat protein